MADMKKSEKMYHVLTLEEYIEWYYKFESIELKKSYYERSRNYFDEKIIQFANKELIAECMIIFKEIEAELYSMVKESIKYTLREKNKKL